MKIESSGVVFVGECDIQSADCIALTPKPITAVFTMPQRKQINACRPCIQNMIRSGLWELDNAKLPTKSDVVAYDPSGHAQLVVEVKTVPFHLAQPEEQWAVRVRRNLLMHGGIPSSPYFMLIVWPTHGYLWAHSDEHDGNRKPSLVVDIQQEFADLVESANNSDPESTAVSGMAKWLRDVAQSGNANEVSKAHPWAVSSGLFDAIRGTRVQTELLSPASFA